MSSVNAGTASNYAFLRKWSLFLLPPPGGGFGANVAQPVGTYAPGQQALDLSNLQFRFAIRAPDVQTPNTATIRIYNPAPATVQKITQEFSKVTLNAGYQNGPFGQVFTGDIKWIRKGKEDAVTSFVEIDAGDGDLAYLNSTLSQTLAAGATNGDIAAAIGASFAKNNVQAGSGLPATTVPTTGGILPRGKVLFGMSRAAARTTARTTNMTWSIQNGVLTWVPVTGYLPGEAIVLTSKTGMIGVPESTEQGIRIRCLLNPNIVVGGLAKIDNASINQTQINEQGYPDYASINLFADTSADGTYKVLVREMVGDTRGQEWYSDLVCIAVDSSVNSGATSGVQPWAPDF